MCFYIEYIQQIRNLILGIYPSIFGMTTKHNNSHHKKIYTIIAGIWLAFCSIFIVQATNEGKIYDKLYSNKDIYTSEKIDQEINHIKDTLQANEEIKNQNYETALTLISGNTSEDYYNRWTIQTLLAYKNGLQNNISWRENAKVFIAQAQNSFDIAQKLWPSKAIKDAININKTTTTSLSTVINIKTCYGIGQNIVTSITTTQNITQGIKQTLQEEETYLNKRAQSLDKECYQRLEYIVDSSKEQVAMLQLEMEYNKQTYLTDLSEKIEDPLLCIQSPYENILPSLTKGNIWLQQYQEGHQNTIDALKKNTQESIYELCNESKNDSEINQDIENSVQDMLEKLSNTQEDPEENEATKNSQEIQYKDFFTENEKEALQEIQESNQSRIENILNIRGKWNYEADKYLNDTFNQFYGNSWDFINLHK